MGNTVYSYYLSNSFGNLQQNKVNFVTAAAGGTNPWTEQMQVSGRVVSVKQNTKSGQYIATVGDKTNPAKLTYIDTNQTQTFGTVRVPQIASDGTVTYKDTDTGTYGFTYTLYDEEYKEYIAATNNGVPYTISASDIGWELFRKGYIDNWGGLKETKGISYSLNSDGSPVSGQSTTADVITGTAYAGDGSICALDLEATNVPNQITTDVNSKLNTTTKVGTNGVTATTAIGQKNIYAFVYYPRTAQQTVQVSYQYYDADGNVHNFYVGSDGKITTESGVNDNQKISYITGTANTEIFSDALSTVSNVEIPGYELVSHTASSLTKFDTVGASMYIDQKNEFAGLLIY